MSILIQQLLEQQNDKWWAKVKHSDYQFKTLIFGTEEELSSMLGENVTVELDFYNVLQWKTLRDFTDAESCIFSANQSQSFTIRGRVHNIAEIDNGVSIVDIYIKNGVEFLAIDSQDLGGQIPSVGVGLELSVEGLCFYPVRT